ncbi:MAG: leucine-rich repeat domain-containing protein, partial [Thermoguttaceae bacterium]|nr:leucine-rich repeat domain-containing protein [Thermoguttaceae bacterium]
VSAFEGCTSLKGVGIPDSVTEIGVSAFEGCTSLESVEIPDSVTEIGYSAFEGCTSLERVSVPQAAQWEEDTFKNCPKLKITRRRPRK